MLKIVFRNPSLFYLMILIFSGLFSGCSSLNQIALKQDLKKLPEKSEVVSNYFIGISLYDPETQEYLIDVNADKYFTPASNTKILTLASWLGMAEKQIPSFYYALSDDNLYIVPLGDPTFLHPDFPIQESFTFIQDNDFDTLFIFSPQEKIEPFGSGWAWDDYNYSYQPERSYFPMYGNTVHTFLDDRDMDVVPPFFEAFIEDQGTYAGRSKDFNLFQLPREKYIHMGETEIQMPFKTNDELIERLLEDTLSKPVKTMIGPYSIDSMKRYAGYNRLPVLAQMMLNSDNFLAEQLLLNAQLSQHYENQDLFLAQTKASLFNSCPQPLEWVDGSGLSRYNMFTPMSMVKILEVIYRQLSWQEISLIFPKGGVSGTIKNWYAAETPYVFAKTGTLRHNHALSGYIITKSGKRLIFSIMNNHYTNGTTEVKQQMQKILEAIRDAY